MYGFKSCNRRKENLFNVSLRTTQNEQQLFSRISRVYDGKIIIKTVKYPKMWLNNKTNETFECGAIPPSTDLRCIY